MLNLVANGPSGYNLTNSLRTRASASANLSRTTGTSTSATTWTWSAWVKRGTLGSVQALFSGGSSGTSSAATTSMIYFDNTDVLGVQFSGGTTGISTTAVYRDPSSWYHIVVKVAATTATIYVNGTQIATGSVTPTYINAISTIQYIGYQNYSGSTRYFDGYMTEVNFIDGQALNPSSFGSTNATTGVWQPAKYTGTYGTNGFYLNFNSIALTSGSNTGLGKDNSGNGNYWNTNNISVTAGTTYDAMTDVPTLTSATVANYATFNPLVKSYGTVTFSNANLLVTFDTNWNLALSTITLPTSGKFYWENIASGTEMFGLYNPAQNTQAISPYTHTGGVIVYWGSNGYKYVNGTTSAYGATFTAGDIIGVAVDLDASTVTFYKNNTSQGSISLASNMIGVPLCATSFGNSLTPSVNFGQRPFTYTPPSGFVALNTYNLPTSTIVQGNKYMDATTYTATGTTQTITNASGFLPDLVWTKARSTTGDNILTDAVRGVTKVLYSNLTSAEVTTSTYLTSFNSNGYSVGTGNYPNGTTMVGWQWQAGQGSSGSNTSGTITSTVSVNASAGFSVVTYTGTGANATVGHGLGVAPKMVIVKSRSNATDWVVWQTSLTGLQYLNLNQTAAVGSLAAVWNSTIPTSSVINLGTNAAVNNSGYTFVAYCWSEIAGFSKFGSYTGNGSTDGPFVYTGFRPKFVMIKRTDSTGSWYMLDTSRATYNVVNPYLLANVSNSEATDLSWDILSNGFKLRSSYLEINTNGATMIYMAFAENPFKNALAR
jgi:hypothetical protein